MGAGRRAEDGVARRVRGEVEAAGGLAREGGGGTCACEGDGHAQLIHT